MFAKKKTHISSALFISSFMRPIYSLEKSVCSSECDRTRNQDFATGEGLELKVIFFPQKLFYLCPMLNKSLQLKRITEGPGSWASSRWIIFVVLREKIAILCHFDHISNVFEAIWIIEVELRTQGSRPRPRTALPRTEPLEAKDRNARGQGPRTETQVFSKKIFFRRSQKKSSKKFLLVLELRSKGFYLQVYADDLAVLVTDVDMLWIRGKAQNWASEQEL